jgi:hypothetical protein
MSEFFIENCLEPVPDLRFELSQKMEEKISLSWVLLGTALVLTSVAMALQKANKHSEALHANLESLQSANR